MAHSLKVLKFTVQMVESAGTAMTRLSRRSTSTCHDRFTAVYWVMEKIFEETKKGQGHRKID
jgi:hypothetical protein